MICYIGGADHYRCQQKLKTLKEEFSKKRGGEGLNIVNLDGINLDFDQFKQEALTTPFMGEKKMIIIKNLKTKNETNKKILDFLKTKEKKLENVLVFFELKEEKEKSSADNTLSRYLKKERYLWELNPLNSRELKNWLKKYTQDEKIKIATEAINELIITTGNDLNALTNELKKLTAYKNGGVIEANDVKTLVKAKFDENIFNLIDAIGQKNQSRALKLISNQLASGSHPLLILKMITRQFKILLQIKEVTINSSLNFTTLANQLRLHPYVIKKSSLQIKNFSKEKLIGIYRELIEIEKKLKNGRENPELIFDLFVLKNC